MNITLKQISDKPLWYMTPIQLDISKGRYHYLEQSVKSVLIDNWKVCNILKLSFNIFGSFDKNVWML